MLLKIRTYFLFDIFVNVTLLILNKNEVSISKYKHKTIIYLKNILDFYLLVSCLEVIS